jgi:hypothetical protein
LSSSNNAISTSDIVIPINSVTVVSPTLSNRDIQIIDPQIQMCVLLDPLTDIILSDKYMILCGAEGTIKLFIRQQHRSNTINTVI